MGRPKKTKRTPPRRALAPLPIQKTPVKRKQWTNVQMCAAIKAIQNGAGSINRVALDHGVPPTTLKDRLSGRVIHGKKPGPVPYLDSQEEEALEDYLLQVSSVGYGKTRRQVKSIVGNVAADKGILRKSHVSDGWWRRFLERHPKLSLRHGDATGHVRMNAITRENIQTYFDLLKEVLDENDFAPHPERMYNMDETGMPLDPKPPRVVTRKGQRKVRYRCSGSKGQITVIGCCNGTGQAIPPMVIFNAKQLNPMWTQGEIPGTRYGLSDKGWTDQELFKGWLKDHFLVHAVPGRPLLLLVDGHSSHFEPETLRYAADHSVIIFCLPPHTTHEAQPLDVSFFGPLKKHWVDVTHDFYQSSPGKVITKFNFSVLFAKAWLKTCVPSTICSGFKKAGVIPFDPETILKLTPPTENNSSSQQNSSTSSASQQTQQTNSTSSASQQNNSTSSDAACSEDDDADKENGCDELEELYMARLEEGYDIFDPEYVEWLRRCHPDVTPPEPLDSSVASHFGDIEPSIPATPSITPTPEPVISLAVTPPVPEFDAPPNTNPPVPASPPNTNPPVPDAPHRIHASPLSISVSCSASTSVPPSSAPLSVIVSCSATASAQETPPLTSTVCSTEASVPMTPQSSRSPATMSTPSSALSRHLQPISLLQPSNSQKTGRARVLTSADCLKMLEEKKEKKRLEIEEKEQRKRDREQRKKERELAQKQKREERELQLRKKREAAAARKKAPAKRACKRSKRVLCDGLGVSATALTSVGASPALPSIVHSPDGTVSSGEDGASECECPFCHESYSDGGQDWIKCVCGRWVHEECVEDIHHDSDGQEIFCPFCINTIAI